MANKQIRIEGDERLLRQLRALDARTRGRILASIVEAAAKPITVVAQQKAPRAAVHRTGDKRPPKPLADSIRYEMLKKGANVATAGVGPTKDVWYAHFNEFGTVKMAAQPFLRPAYDEKRASTVEQMRRGLRQQIDVARRTR